MNKSEDQIEEIIEDVMQNYQAWHVGTRSYDCKSKGEDGKGSIYAIEQAGIIEKLSSRLEKLESTPSQPPSPSTIPPPSATLLTKGKSKVSSYNTMPLDTSFCENCHEYGHFPNMCPLAHNVSYVDYGPSYEGDVDVEYANAMNERPRYDGPPNQTFNRQAPRGPPMHGSYQGFGQGGEYDSQGRGNYRAQGYQGQAPYGQSHGLGNQTQYNQGSYNPNHQGGGGYNYPYGQYRGASSGGYPSNPGGQYGVSQFPPPGFNGPRTYGN
ncbi:uncharacterized protein [Spinacia oleracea]|uniref:Zinc knuckle CX2CX3GHX4C domain-containing protein n=1 Tax=Spinacia oleracea TaxID=3562 RepID=A0A9R0JE55_SPIOL|nr:uncharacterized protein LOC110803628 [Spinacia oleracea]